MTSETWTWSLSQNRQTRLILCLALTDPGRHRPIAPSVPRPTWVAAMVRTQPMTASGDMAVPPPEVRGQVEWYQPCTRNHLREEPPPFFYTSKTGDGSVHPPLAHPPTRGENAASAIDLARPKSG